MSWALRGGFVNFCKHAKNILMIVFVGQNFSVGREVHFVISGGSAYDQAFDGWMGLYDLVKSAAGKGTKLALNNLNTLSFDVYNDFPCRTIKISSPF